MEIKHTCCTPNCCIGGRYWFWYIGFIGPIPMLGGAPYPAGGSVVFATVCIWKFAPPVFTFDGGGPQLWPLFGFKAFCKFGLTFKPSVNWIKILKIMLTKTDDKKSHIYVDARYSISIISYHNVTNLTTWPHVQVLCWDLR